MPISTTSGGPVASAQGDIVPTSMFLAADGTYRLPRADAMRTGTYLGIANGGTGQTTQQAALNALAGAVTTGRVLAGNGTNVTLRLLAAADLPTATSVSTAPANPTATTSATLVMMGLGSSWAFTPLSSGKTHVVISGAVTTATAAVSLTVGARYGTGGAPSNGAAVSGTLFGAYADYVITPPGTALVVPFTFNTVLSLTASTAYWFDLALSTTNASDAASVSNLSASIVETK